MPRESTLGCLVDETPLGQFIKMQRELANLSVRRLAELADVSNAYLSQVERGIYQPSAHVLKNLADALQVSTETLFTKAGFLDEDAAPRGVEEAIALDEKL